MINRLTRAARPEQTFFWCSNQSSFHVLVPFSEIDTEHVQEQRWWARGACVGFTAGRFTQALIADQFEHWHRAPRTQPGRTWLKAKAMGGWGSHSPRARDGSELGESAPAKPHQKSLSCTNKIRTHRSRRSGKSPFWVIYISKFTPPKTNK